MVVPFRVGTRVDRDELLLKLIDVQYERNDIAFERSRFRIRGDTMELWPSYEEFAYRIEMWGVTKSSESRSLIHKRSNDLDSR